MYVLEDAHVEATRCVISRCQATGNGGGIYVGDIGQVILKNTNISYNTAGMFGDSQAQTMAVGGGVCAAGRGTSQLVLNGATFTNNSARYGGGGLALFEEAILQVRNPAVFSRNWAGTTGGGVRFYSAHFEPHQIAQFIKATNNTAPRGPNIAYAAWQIAVVDQGNADNFITSDNEDGVLRVKLNVSGANGFPSDDAILYTSYNDKGNALVTQEARGIGQGIKEVPISFKQPPGKSPWLFGAPTKLVSPHFLK
jgi:parallel beta-helix repeat protein